MRFTAIAFVAAGLSTGAASAHTPYRAGDDGSVRHVVVRYSELDLTHEEGARVLLGRIHQAARTVCGPEPSGLSIDEYQRYTACINESTETTVQRVHAPMVSAIYASTPKPRLYAERAR
ncbi:UrcA family protein [Phenylobacterium sp.]|jgi:UrcA family protein|uniref:UrcA family protein n=1 Tax=Phenylobacterium sp. TaxID=1871053 RepID=UPI002F419894